MLQNGAGNEASRSASPKGVTENASTPPEYDLDINISDVEVNKILESIVLPHQSKTAAQEQSRNAMRQVLETGKTTLVGAYRDDIGGRGDGNGKIAFLWGTPGAEPLFADGDGLSRIIAKQDFEKKFLPDEPSGKDLCMLLADIVTRGRIKRRYGTSNHPMIDISWRGEIATLKWSGGRKV